MDGHERYEDQEETLLKQFLQRNPEEAVRWVLFEAKTLRHPNVDVERTNLYRIARAFGSRPFDEQQRLAQSCVSGFIDAPEHVRNEVADNIAEIVRNSLEAVREDKDNPTMSPRGNEEFPPLLANFLKVVDGAGFYQKEIPDQQRLMKVCLQAAVRTGPAGAPPMRELAEVICKVYTNLRVQERQQLSKTVMAPRLFGGEGNLWIVERALAPQGYAEMSNKILGVERSARFRWWAYLMVPLVQIGLCFGLKPCQEVPMRYWLGADAVLWLLALVTAWLAYRWGCPAFRELLIIMTGAGTASPGSGNLLGPLWPAIIMAILCVIFLFTGSLAAFLATIYLVVAIYEDCAVVTTSVCGIFILMRHCTTSVLGFHVAWLVQEICFVMRKLVNPHVPDSPRKSHSPAEKGYGSMGQAA
jgi:hypothetical protein